MNAFRQALGCFPTGVALVTTTDHEGNSLGLTCNSFASVSLDPPLVLWSLRRESRLLPVFQKARGYAINVLAQDQRELSTRFASANITDKFAGVPHRRGVHDVPLIEACIARFECSAFEAHQVGDHFLFIGRVERFDQDRRDGALVFQQGAYKATTACGTFGR